MQATMLLLVDDQADVRFLLGLFLGDAGYAFEEATTSEAGLAAARSGAFELVLLDQQMPPGPTGLEVAETLRAEGHAGPIVLYSAFLEPSVAARARALGVVTVGDGEPDRVVEAIRAELGPGRSRAGRVAAAS
jgi:CheY-like chemotaxis protein